MFYIVHDVCKAIVKLLVPRYVRLPRNEDELIYILTGFKQSRGFRCGGAINGSHIPVSVPSKLRIDYYNRKGWYSVVLEGLVDLYYMYFTDIYVGWPRSVHDTHVFANSDLYHTRKGQRETLFPKSNSQLERDNNIPVVVLEDSAYYPLMRWILKPFPHSATT